MYNYDIEKSTIAILYLAQSISDKIKLGYITKETLFTSTMTYGDSPLNKSLLQKGLSQPEILEKSLDILKNIKVPVNNPHSTIVAENYSFKVADDLLDLFSICFERVKERNTSKISIKDIIFSLSISYPDLFEKISIDDQEKNSNNLVPISTFDYTHDTSFVLPRELGAFLTVLNNKYSRDETECEICGRDTETEQLIRILMKMTKRNAVLVGEPGVGKTALVEKFAWMIATGNCHDRFKNSVLLSLDVTSIIAGTRYRGDAEERFTMLIDFLEEHPECILFIDEIHLLLGAGACKDGELDLANALKPLLARGKTQVIGATTFNEYEKYFSQDGALKRRFEKIIVKEPLTKDIYPMIKVKVKKLEQQHHVSISRDLIDFVILNASCYNYETKNPDRTLDLLDKTMVCTELDSRIVVTKEDVLKNFSINQQQYDNMKYSFKKATAYHEVGHFLVTHFSPSLDSRKVLAISIMPAENYLGVNVFEDDPNVTPSGDKQYYIQLIASLIAGRVAEKMYTNTITGGASNDLYRATEIAKKMITLLALDESFTDNRVFKRDVENPMYTDSLISEINTHIDKILEEAKKYAEYLLKEKEYYLTILVEQLTKHGMLSSKEIEDILKKCDKELEVINNLKKEIEIEEKPEERLIDRFRKIFK